MTTTEANRQIERWRWEVKKARGYTDMELGKKIGCSGGIIQRRSSKKTLYGLPYLTVMRLKALAEEIQ